jgi:hypothetical protein
MHLVRNSTEAVNFWLSLSPVHLWDNPPMLTLDPSDPEEIAFALKKAVKQSGLSLTELFDRLDEEYGVKLSISALSQAIWRGTIRLQRALQILAVCGVEHFEIMPPSD